MTGKYDHAIVNFMPKQHDNTGNSTSLPTGDREQRRTYITISSSLPVTSSWSNLPDNFVQPPNIKTFESRPEQEIYWKKS